MINLFEKRIAVIGAGKAAHSIVPAFIKKGLMVTCIVSRSLASAKHLAEINSIPFYSDQVSLLPGKTDVVFITTPDRQISFVASELSLLDFEFRNLLIVHVSGACSVSDVKILNEQGSATASFHIMQTFPSRRAVKIKGCYAAIETESLQAAGFLKELSAVLGLKHFMIDPAYKALYHLSAVMASNFMTANLYNASCVFTGAKTKDADFIDVVRPIVEQTLKNILQSGLANAISGPLERGDIETVKKHIEMLADGQLKGGKEIYVGYISNSISLLRLIEERNGVLSDEQAEIKNFLEKRLTAKFIK